MNRKTFAVLLLVLCAPARQAHASSAAGTTAGGFLNLPADAQRAAMGDASAACARGSSALFLNPAALSLNKRQAAGFSHALLPESLTYDALSYAYPLGARGTAAVGVQSLRYGSVESLDNNGDPAGSLSPADAAYTLGWGGKVDPDIAVGASVKYVSSRIYRTASAAALDLGVLVRGEDLDFGFAVQNLGKGLKFNSEYSPLPVNVKLGVLIPYQLDWEWVVDVNFPKDGSAWLGAGAEYVIDINAKRLLYLRAGYNTAAADTGGLNGFSVGFGAVEDELSFDYALRTMGELGATHHLGLGYRWGK